MRGRGGPRRAARSPGAGDHRLAPPRPGRPVLRSAWRACPRRRVRRRRARSSGVGGGRRSGARAPARAGSWRRMGVGRLRPARRPSRPRYGLAAGAWLPHRRHHGLDGQDIGQGHLPRGPAAPRAQQPGELQHRDRPSARDPRGAPRDGGPRARDGDAREGLDRRSLPYRGTGRRRHHEHRPGPSRAPGDDRGHRGGEGGDPRRGRAAGHRGRAG